MELFCGSQKRPQNPHWLSTPYGIDRITFLCLGAYAMITIEIIDADIIRGHQQKNLRKIY